MSIFQKKIEELINIYSKENESNTPDFILAQYLMDCLETFNKTVNERTKWYEYKDIDNTVANKL